MQSAMIEHELTVDVQAATVIASEVEPRIA
jgi:hypothetical protein